MTYGQKLLIRVSLLLFFAVSSARATAQQATISDAHQVKVILGVLEDVPGKYSGEADFGAVRTVFEKVGDDWQAFRTRTESYHDLETLPMSYPKAMTWTVAFDGRNLGEITSQTPPHFRFYSEIGVGNITSRGPVPTVGQRSIEYAGFLGTPVYRPLVAVSKPNFSDPEQWKPAQLSPALIAAARKQFRNKFPKASNCKNPEENILRPWNYRDEDVVITKGYSSKDGWSLLELKLTGNACDGNSQDAFHGQWYVVGSSGEVRFLATDMWLVDAGDYDNSGKSELLFSIDGYNMGGYRLFYRDFTQSAEFLFHYQ
jgi:hypothetical protein